MTASKTYVLYHAGCNDGFGAAWACSRALGDVVEYLPVRYGEPVPAEVTDGSSVMIVDFSYSRIELEALRARGCEVLVLDHHTTAQKELEGLEYARFDMSKSGAVMTWEHLFPTQAIPELLLYIQDRDLWQWKLPESGEVSAALNLYERDFKVWGELMNKVDQLRKEGAVALKVVQQQAQRQAGQASLCTWLHNGAPLQVAVVNATTYQSETGHEMLALFPEASFVALYRDDLQKGMRRWSLRSRKDFDCSQVAKARGGGGHAQACGFEEKLAEAGTWGAANAGVSPDTIP